MNGCCTTTRHDDGVLDREAINRAVQGQPTPLTRKERSMVVWRLHSERSWGLDRISAHLGYSRSSVAEILANTRRP